ncbi:30S ribosomal protein S16 [Phycicoccus sp. CSK15P-2]|uniref:30S ribosomal protein S16 n=1 Tax=Phycicoccus sp. CSK15P-2 TaxID=2807627 RepID=UPI00194EA736|nr:30S ribosomal protein S16 [Phycicoccus sp. CSK15P-2]MBM6404758.1 30S ribosomal protein S16 [Phycicoccus sp. CSK15P-2]
MAVKIRLKRMGKIRTAIYRVVVMDSRTKRDGRAIEEIGRYDPNQEPSLIEIDMERADYWVGQGAQPTEAVAALLKHYKDGTLKVAEPKQSKKDLYEAAVAAAGRADTDGGAATTPRKKTAKKAAEETPAEQAPAADEAPAEAPQAEAAPAADTDSGEAAAESTDADADAADSASGEDKA